MADDTNKYWTVKDVANYLGMKVQTIYNMVHNCKIPFHKIGLKSVRFKKDEIDSWIEASKRKEASQLKYVIKDGHPFLKFTNPQRDYDGYFVAKNVAKEVLALYQHQSGKYKVSVIEKEIEKILKNRIVVPEVIIKDKKFFTYSDLYQIVNLIIIAEGAAVVWEKSIGFYNALLEAARRNADEFSFSPENEMSVEEQAYHRKDIVKDIIARIQEIAITFAVKGRMESQPEYVNEYVDFPSFLQAFTLDYIYFTFNDYIDGWGDREISGLIRKERSLDELSPSYIKTGLDQKFFIADEILEPIEEHVGDLEAEIKELKKIIRAIKRKK